MSSEIKKALLNLWDTQVLMNGHVCHSACSMGSTQKIILCAHHSEVASLLKYISGSSLLTVSCVPCVKLELKMSSKKN